MINLYLESSFQSQVSPLRADGVLVYPHDVLAGVHHDYLSIVCRGEERYNLCIGCEVFDGCGQVIQHALRKPVQVGLVVQDGHDKKYSVVLQVAANLSNCALYLPFETFSDPN